MPSTHARLQPSSAERWLTCPGSVALSADVVDTGSSYADEGTAGHEVFSLVLGGADLRSFVGTKATNGVEITEALVDLLSGPVDFVREYMATHPGAALHSEIKLQIGAPAFELPDDQMWGTSDLVIQSPDELLVGDLKLGYVDVPVRDNAQLMCYALGALYATGWINDNVRFVILQPRTSTEPKEVVVTAAEIEAWQFANAKKVFAAYHGGPLVPSEDACRFCKAAAVCPELRKETLALARREFASEAIKLTGPEIADLLRKGEMVESAIKALRSHALKLLEIDADAVPGYKRVQGKKHRRWVNETDAAMELKKMGVDPYTKELISPAQAETKIADLLQDKKGGTKKAAKEAAKSVISTIAETPPGEATLVPATDERPALPPAFTKEDVQALDASELID